MPTIEVDGRTLEVKAGQMLIEAAESAGIYIPRFCYHEKLSIAANCRMCLVEVEKAPKPMPACATQVMEGMKVHTRSEVAKEAQRGTMEFLLINHPLDCPVCDQGGECPLQDQAMGYGGDNSRYHEPKRVVPNPDIGPLIATEMTRCIHCTRCIRFGEEVAGIMEMGAPGRGEFTRIGTFLDRSIDSEVSGNIIDLCPVGALTSKPYRFSARSWELQSHAVISPHDCVGTNMQVQTLRGVVERVLPAPNESVNECWLADRDRFSYEAVNSKDRLLHPMIREGQDWKEVPWQTALEQAVRGLESVIQSGRAEDIGALASPTVTLEEAYLLQKLLRQLGSDNVDHRLQQQDFRDDSAAPLFPALELPIAALDSVQAALLVGSDLRKEQPLLSVRLRRAVRQHGARVGSLDVIQHAQNHDLCDQVVVPPAELVAALANVALAVSQQMQVSLPAEIAEWAERPAMAETVSSLCAAGETGVIILGAIAQQHEDAAGLKTIAQWVAECTGVRLGTLAPANSAAAWVAGCVPHRRVNGAPVDTPGMHAADLLKQGCRGYLLLGTEPEYDALDRGAACHALAKAEFTVRISAFDSEWTRKHADVLLPMAAFTESAGTFINCEGRIQHSTVAASPMGDSRPAWKILRVLGNFFQVSGFDQITLQDVQDEIALGDLNPSARSSAACYPKKPRAALPGLQCITEMPIYRVDPTVRRAQSLQQTADNPPPRARLHPETLTEQALTDGQVAVIRSDHGQVTLPVLADARIPKGCFHIPAGFRETGNIEPSGYYRMEPGESA